MSEPTNSCFDCAYHQASGSTLLGFCRWFTVHQNKGAKPVPPEIADKGCAFFMPKRAPIGKHYHHCSSCDERHRWTCEKKNCRFAVILPCPNSAAPITRRPT
jgi:hypothetical protein